jgi:hypothetical protein
MVAMVIMMVMMMPMMLMMVMNTMMMIFEDVAKPGLCIWYDDDLQIYIYRLYQ